MDAEMEEKPALSGHAVTRRYAIDAATKLQLSGPGTVLIERGAAEVMTVSALAEDHERLEIKVGGDSVKVGYQSGLLRNRAPQGTIEYQIALPILTELKAVGGLHIIARAVDTRDLEIGLEGGSTIELSDVRANELELSVKDKGQATVTGQVVSFDAMLAGGSTLDAAGLVVDDAEIELSGECTASASATKHLKAKIEGKSTLTFSGATADLEVRTAGESRFMQV